MAHAELQVSYREELGKNKVKEIKKQGLIPAIVYGEGDPMPITIERRAIDKLYYHSKYGKNTIIELNVEGKKSEKVKVISKALDYHPVKNVLRHIDFVRVSDEKEVTVNIPVDVVGTSPGQKMGGVIILGKRNVYVSCLPTKIPVHYELDVTPLELGDKLTVGDIPKLDGITFLGYMSTVLVSVELPRAEKAVTVLESDEEGEAGLEGEEGAEGAEGADAAKGESEENKEG